MLLPKTSMTEDSVEIARKSFTSSERPRKRTLSKGFRNSLSSRRKRRKVRVISSTDSNCSSPSSHSTLRPVTVKTWIQVASDVETYRKLVEAGAKLHREKSRIEKRNRRRSSKHKRKYERKIQKL